MRVNNTRGWWALMYDPDNRKVFETAILDNKYGEHKAEDVMFATDEYGDYVDEGLWNAFIGWCLQIIVTQEKQNGI